MPGPAPTVIPDRFRRRARWPYLSGMTPQTTPSASPVAPAPPPGPPSPPAPPAPPVSEIVRADPAMRRQALLIVLAGALAGVLVIRFGIPWLEYWVARARMTGDYGARRMVCLGAGGAIAALGALVVVSGVNMVRIGRRVARGDRFPPEGMRVLRDTPVLRGPRAVALGRVQEALGVLLLACAAGLLGLGGYVIVLLWP